MATFDQLPADQRAILELVLQRGNTYDDLSGMLGMPASRVRELARDALSELAPATARRVDENWRGQVADYLLNQQSGPESTATRGHLKRSEAARAWALSLLDSLDPLYGNGTRPEIPEAEASAPARPQRPPRSRPAERPRRERPSGPLSDEARSAIRRRRIGGALAALAVVLLVVLVWPIGVLTGGDDDGDNGGGDGQTAGQPQVVGSPVVLRPIGDEKGAGGAVIAEQGDQRVIIVQASGLRRTRQPNDEGEGGTAYEVWLYNSPEDAVSIGAQVTDEQGNFQGAGPLPDDYEKYKFIDISREKVDRNPAHSGNSVIRGELADVERPPADAGGQGGAGSGATPPPANGDSGE